MLEFEIWSRNSFDIKAVRITRENLKDVALWVNGEVARTRSHHPRWFVLVDTVQYNRLRQTKAFVGDWIIETPMGFKHYRDESFRLAYSPKKTVSQETIQSILKHAIRVDLGGDQGAIDELASHLTDRIMDEIGVKDVDIP